MEDIQKLIDEMHSGNTDAIIKNISAEVPFFVLHAIMAGTKNGLKDAAFIEGVRMAEANDAVLLGIPVSKIATASLHLLNEKKYNGSDAVIKQLIESKFDM